MFKGRWANGLAEGTFTVDETSSIHSNQECFPGYDLNMELDQMRRKSNTFTMNL